jgi:hypothetical protein
MASQAASGVRWAFFNLRAGQLANSGYFSAIAMAFRWEMDFCLELKINDRIVGDPNRIPA